MTKQDTALIVEADGRAMIPLFRLKKSEKNARKVPHSSASIEALAASIAVRGIKQNLVVEPELDSDQRPTGYYLVTAGEGRRLAQLKRLKNKEIKKTEPLPCLIDSIHDARETSLDENISREAMHPADQYEAFKLLADEQGYSAEDIAARFGISVQTVTKRMKLGALSPRLMALYREDKLRLDQMMAFTLTDDHARQEEVLDLLNPNNLYPNSIRNCLTETQMPASERIAVFVGAEAYQAAGGTVTSDLFSENVYFTDRGLAERLAMEHLTKIAEDLMTAEGWKWFDCALSYRDPDYALRAYQKEYQLSEADEAQRASLSEAYDAVQAEYEGADELPETVVAQLNALDEKISALDRKRFWFEPEDIARGGIMVSLSHGGALRIERGFIRAEDKKLKLAEVTDETALNDGSETELVTEDEEAQASLPDSLIRGLTAHRSMGLRLALGENPDLAYLAATHALVCQVFYKNNSPHSIEIRAQPTYLESLADDLAEGLAATEVTTRHDALLATLPASVNDLWSYLSGLSYDVVSRLFAHCIAQTVNVTRQPHERYARMAAESIATASGLDMTKVWQPTAKNYFKKVTKAQILADITEAKGAAAAHNVTDLKKADMAYSAEVLFRDSDWLPLPLRTLQAG
jgi:ParB family chromosome partitioning protein